MGRKLAIYENGRRAAIPFPSLPTPIGMPYDYDAGSPGDPGSGEFRFDASYVYFDDISAGGVNVETWLATITAAGAIYFCSEQEPTEQVGGWETTGPAQDMTGYWRIPVSSAFGYAITSGDAAQRFRFNFLKYGMDGDPGATGSPGATGRVVGEIKDYAGIYLPTGYLYCDGAPLNIGTFPDLAKAIGTVYGRGGAEVWTVSITNGSTTITSSSAHGLSVGSPFASQAMLSCNITIPEGTQDRRDVCYEVVEVMSTTTFRVGLPGTGTPVSFTASFSGQTVWGTFNIPDFRGRVGVGRDDMNGLAANRLLSLPEDGKKLSETGGAETHLLLAAESGLPSHSHTVGGGQNTVQRTNTGANTAGIGGGSTGANTALNASQAHNNLQPFGITNKIICVTP